MTADESEQRPVPGEQFPAAVLPQSEFGPKPPAVVHTGPPPPGVPSAPRNKPMITLAVLAVLFFLTTTAFGAMWAIEQSDHKGTDSELRTVRDNLSKTTTELENARSLYSEATSDKLRVESNIKALQACVDAADAYLKATNEQDADKHYGAMLAEC
jgi:hypothetical protein